MEQVQAADKEIGNSQKKQIIAAYYRAGVPRDHEDTGCHNDAEKFGKAVEQKVVIEACHIESEQKG